jgi:hypothetical protein
MERCVNATASSILDGLPRNMVQAVSLDIRFHLHHFSILSKNFLPKELSQIFAQIPGGGIHAISRVGL